MFKQLRESQVRQLEKALIIAYAISLPLSLSLSWLLLLVGLVLFSLRMTFLLAQACRSRPKKQELFCKLPALTIPVLALSLSVFLSGWLAGGLKEALQSFYSLRQLVVYFWAFSLFSADVKLSQTCLTALLAVGAVAGLWGAVQQIFGFHPFGYPYLQGTGFLSNPMAFAGQMQILSLLSLGISISCRTFEFKPPYRKSILVILVTLFNVAGVVFAGERSAWLGFILGLLTMACLFSYRLFVRLGLVLVGLSVVAYCFLPLVHDRINQLTLFKNDVSVSVRFFLWQQSIEHWRSKPFFGVGIRNYPHFDLPFAIVPGHSKDINHAHSNYLHLLTTLGLVGFLAYLWLCFSVIRCAYVAYQSSDLSSEAGINRGVYLGILGGWISLMVSGIFEYNFGTSQVRLLQWFVLAMLPAKMVEKRRS